MSASSSNELLYEVQLSGAGMWSKIIGRGKTLRFEDIEGGGQRRDAALQRA